MILVQTLTTVSDTPEKIAPGTNSVGLLSYFDHARRDSRDFVPDGDTRLLSQLERLKVLDFAVRQQGYGQTTDRSRNRQGSRIDFIAKRFCLLRVRACPNRHVRDVLQIEPKV